MNNSCFIEARSDLGSLKIENWHLYHELRGIQPSLSCMVLSAKGLWRCHASKAQAQLERYLWGGCGENHTFVKHYRLDTGLKGCHVWQSNSLVGCPLVLLMHYSPTSGTAMYCFTISRMPKAAEGKHLKPGFVRQPLACSTPFFLTEWGICSFCVPICLIYLRAVWSFFIV